MPQKQLSVISKSARLYLWPAIAGNAVIVTSASGAGIAKTFLLGMSICCLASFGFLVNDLLDRPVDRVNCAHRLEEAEPSLRRFACYSSAWFLVLGLLSSSAISSSSFGLSCWIAVGLALYSAIIRRVLLVANLLSALLGTVPLWAPLMLWRRHALFVLPLLLGIYIMFVAREIILDIKDEYGDRSVGRHTFATLYGGRVAGLVASCVSIAAGCIFLVAAIRASCESSPMQAVFCWLLFSMLLGLVIIPGLRVSLASLDAAKLMPSYISCSRMAMIILPIILGLALLVD